VLTALLALPLDVKKTVFQTNNDVFLGMLEFHLEVCLAISAAARSRARARVVC
jgi:hypothetical protein